VSSKKRTLIQLSNRTPENYKLSQMRCPISADTGVKKGLSRNPREVLLMGGEFRAKGSRMSWGKAAKGQENLEYKGLALSGH